MELALLMLVVVVVEKARCCVFVLKVPLNPNKRLSLAAREKFREGWGN